ncbi:MAG: hypothetical protein QXD43_00865 [Candidatus Aenigmatarchaeota archaeon]
MNKCNFRVDKRCLLPANRTQTSNPMKLRERSPYVSEMLELGLHKRGEDYIPNCEEILYCPLRDKNGKKR